jgi:serine/threonine protein kinase/Tfp pilus assembly protein PilF
VSDSDQPRVPSDISERETEGIRIGRYRLLQKIGEGGFGVVWMAEQRDPVVRKVALKVIKLGMDTRQVIARFEAERQALALMDHPGIAKVFDGGTTDTGRPYFVMELVRGVPITHFCDESRLSTRERLELFVQVCNAVQHAHQKGVIHRDIKPSNVLVALHDGVASPKVIDFGIAKATSVRLTEKTMFTEMRQMIGTPEYMAPEQAELSGLDVDTRADVYSLGVLLYELLTSTKPFDLRSVLDKGYEEVLRTIREIDPPKPSTRISTLGADLTIVAARRRADPRDLGRAIRGDLDWIVMRALEKDRTRRYPAASDLAAEVRRHLADEPVLAMPPSTAYRIQKYVRRHRVVVAASAAIALSLVAGLVASAVGWLEAREQGEIARAHATEAEAQKLVAESARSEEQRQRERAEHNATEARESAARAKAVADLLQSALSAANPYQRRGKDYTVRELLDGIEKELGDRLRAEPDAELALRTTMAAAYRGLGAYDKAEAHFERVLALLREKFTGDHHEIAEQLDNLATMIEKRGDWDRAASLYREALQMERRLDSGDVTLQATILNDMGLLANARGDMAAGEKLLREALELLSSDPRAHEAEWTLKTALINTLMPRGEFAEAESVSRDVIAALRERHAGDDPNLALAMSNRAFLLDKLGRSDESDAQYVEALAMMRRIYDRPHPDIAGCLNNYGALIYRMGRIDDAERALSEALEMLRALGTVDLSAEAQIEANLGGIAWKRGDHAGAVAHGRKALASFERQRAREDPECISVRKNLLTALRAAKEAAAAEPLARVQLECCRNTYGADHEETLWSLEFLSHMLAATSRRSADDARAGEAEELARELVEKRARTAPGGESVLAARACLGGALIARARTESDAAQRDARLSEARALLDGCWVSAVASSKTAQREVATTQTLLYKTWNDLAPDPGREARHEEWKARVAEIDGKTP